MHCLSTIIPYRRQTTTYATLYHKRDHG